MSSFNTTFRDKLSFIKNQIDIITWKRKGENKIKNIDGNYTLTPEDIGKMLVVNGAYTLTIPANFLPGLGSQIDIIAQGGVITLTTAGPSLQSTIGNTSFGIAPQYGVSTLIQSTETVWVATGNLIP